MRAITLFLVLLVASSSLGTSKAKTEFLDHQYYSGGVAQALKAVERVLAETGIGVIGTDEAGAVVVSRAYDITGAEPDLVNDLGDGQKLYAVLVVSVSTKPSDSVAVEIATILRAKAGERGLVHSHGWVGGNTLTQRVYSGLERYLGKGHLTSYGS